MSSAVRTRFSAAVSKTMQEGLSCTALGVLNSRNIPCPKWNVRIENVRKWKENKKSRWLTVWCVLFSPQIHAWTDEVFILFEELFNQAPLTQYGSNHLSVEWPSGLRWFRDLFVSTVWKCLRKPSLVRDCLSSSREPVSKFQYIPNVFNISKPPNNKI